MITYELAKELKEAGFPQIIWNTQNYYDERKIAVISDRFLENETIGEKVKIPTLSELIEACGNLTKFVLWQELNMGAWTWWAGYKNIEPGSELLFLSPSGYGSSPEEAVARLWLELNKKPLLKATKKCS